MFILAAIGVLKDKKYFYYRCSSKEDIDLARDCNLPSRLGEKRLLIMSLASYEKFWYNGLKLIPLFISVNFCAYASDIELSLRRFL